MEAPTKKGMGCITFDHYLNETAGNIDRHLYNSKSIEPEPEYNLKKYIPSYKSEYFHKIKKDFSYFESSYPLKLSKCPICDNFSSSPDQKNK